MIRVAIAYPFESELTVKEIEPTLESYYRELECETIEAVPLSRVMVPGVLMVLDEEGKLNGKLPNFQLESDDMVDTIVGNVMFVDGRGEDFASLSDEQIAQLQELWAEMR